MFKLIEMKHELESKTTKEKMDRIYEILTVLFIRLEEHNDYDIDMTKSNLLTIFVQILYAKQKFTAVDYNLIKTVCDRYEIEYENFEYFKELSKEINNQGEPTFFIFADMYIDNLCRKHKNTRTLWCEMYLNIAMLDNVLDICEFNLITISVLKGDCDITDFSELTRKSNKSLCDSKNINSSSQKIKTLDLIEKNDYDQDDIVEAIEDNKVKSTTVRIIYEVEASYIDLDNLEIEFDSGDGESFDEEGLSWLLQVYICINGEYYYAFSFSKIGDSDASFYVKKIEKAEKLHEGKYRFELLVNYTFKDVNM